MLALAENLAGKYDAVVNIDHLRVQAEAGTGVPMQLTRLDTDELFARARIVNNTVELDPDLPSLDEVRAILDAPLEEDEVVAEQIASEETDSEKTVADE